MPEKQAWWPRILIIIKAYSKIQKRSHHSSPALWEMPEGISSSVRNGMIVDNKLKLLEEIKNSGTVNQKSKYKASIVFLVSNSSVSYMI